MRSGSLITARLAGEQGRDVFAVPGHPFDPRASGPNALIRDGATLIRGCDDVLENLIAFEPSRGLFDVTQQEIANDFVDEGDMPENAHDMVLGHLSYTPIAIDELIRACDMSVATMQTILLELDLAGRIKRVRGNRVSLLD
jgi:DNA processing protein